MKCGYTAPIRHHTFDNISLVVPQTVRWCKNMLQPVKPGGEKEMEKREKKGKRAGSFDIKLLLLLLLLVTLHIGKLSKYLYQS
jgi:hypothetical protein